MVELLVLAEHRQGQLRDVTFEMLTKALDLAGKIGAEVTSVVLGKETKQLIEALADFSNRVICVEDPVFEVFNSDFYQAALSKIINDRRPLLTLIGHTYYGLDLAPRLAAALNIPIATDCMDLRFEDGSLVVTRQMYGGKVNAIVRVRKSESYIVSIRPGSFRIQKPSPPLSGKVEKISLPLEGVVSKKRFVEYVPPPPGGVDITAASIIVSIGRGIKDKSNIPLAEELANVLGGVLACSRPIVDLGWLPSDRQVGMSGKTVKPKLYLALGISGAFQHVMGMKGSDLVIAINKDARAPIFGYSDYGVVEDLFKIVPVLKSKIEELKTKRA
ncbi:MAG: electron transfer flavoprotein subunit alpha/FixB family protein [Candidatus Nezhaarchaeota archaeon]|nr:electron transfer flavoprotein subunit alpha/FixB family protein [Candidatus Nezhaarchaeota archaeon]MCX8142092.1 electron transfer flavoprotein subunit alpha/FixB family protein [Candidatus Nezhaarchaeota archaeon]MDW8050127.1 electron transfer flavoprotein subunit alpha/FixB family protein [Nitrososphaerota archaeon]